MKARDFAYDLLFVIESIVLVFWRLAPDSSAYWMSLTAIIALVLLLLSARSAESTAFITHSIIYMAILSALLFSGSFYAGHEITLGGLAFWITGVLLAVCIAANPPSVWAARLALILIMAGVTLFVALNGYYMFPGLSENYASVFCLIGYVVYAASCEVDQKERFIENLVLAFLVVMVSLFAKGRGGIISSMALLLLVLIVCLVKGGRSWRHKLLLASLVVLMLGVITVIGNSDSLSKFSASDVVASHSTEKRLGMLESYLSVSISTPKNFIFGVDSLTIQNAELVRVEGNLHNSYFQTHSIFGLLGLIIVILSLLYTFKDSMKSGRSLFGVAMVAFMIRAITDNVFPLETGNVVMILIILYTLNKLPSPTFAHARCLYAS